MSNKGLYFIYDKETVVYVGKTTDIKKRITSHSSMGPYRAYKFLPIANNSDMAILELAFIDKLKPLENKQDNFTSVSSIPISLPDFEHLPLTYYTTVVKSSCERMAQIPQAEITKGLRDLSQGAFRLLTYYYSRRDGWVFNDDNIANTLDTSARMVKQYRKELIAKSYLLIQRGEVDVYFIGQLAVSKFLTPDLSDLLDDDVAEPLIARTSK